MSDELHTCGWCDKTDEKCECPPHQGPSELAPVSLLEAVCECVHWCRANVNLKYLTNHHENCPHYNDSLMDVWKVTMDGISCYVDNEQDARETAGDEQRDDITVTKEKMHREVFEHLPEFEGF